MGAIIITSALLGYLSMTIKDLIKADHQETQRKLNL